MFKREFKILVMLVCIFSAGFSHADISKTITIITSSSIPPYVISKTHSGIAIDLIRETLALKGYRVKFSYATNKRVEQEINNKRVHGAFNIPHTAQTDLFESHSIVTYNNVAITLTSKNIEINKTEDLQGKSITAFQKAAEFLGQQYKDATKKNLRYSEVTKQHLQILMLHKDRSDVIVMEENVFYYYKQQLQRLKRIKKSPHTIHRIFPPAKRFAVFKSKQVRDDFNDGLKQLHSNGRYKQIVAQYISNDE
ncbi:MAG: polar amino acid transport system substrate-binding protein [Alphaproteobacteria bacterium]|jgi:polar amino acid transport system substrate-binding protein